jgi:hypothetical protein
MRAKSPSKRHLMSFDDPVGQLGFKGQASEGIRAIPIASIVGSVDRVTDFDPKFRPLRRASRNRLASLQRAFSDGSFPPISVHQIGDAYFVSDGHHRVALAHRLGMCFIDADVVRYTTVHAPIPQQPHRHPCPHDHRLRHRIAALAGRHAPEPGRVG